MKKLSPKANKILIISVIAVLLIILAWTIIGLVKTIQKKNAIQVSNMEEKNDENYIEETNEEEINIEELEEFVEENNINNKTSSSSSANKNTNVVSDKKYYIKVNYGANVVTIYSKDESGQYTVPVKAMVCSTGTATPKSGTYGIKGRWRWLGLFGGVYGQYSTQIVGNILFHSVPYLEKGNAGSLEYWEYDKLGTSCSMGCIRLTVRDAKWIYNNVSSGTLVEFYSSSDPGPLGKPSAQKISGNNECRNWDPTDTTEGNPWNSYNEKNTTTENNTNTFKNNELVNNAGQNTTNKIENTSNTNNTTNESSVNNVINNVVNNKVNNIIKNNVNTNISENENVDNQNVDIINS